VVTTAATVMVVNPRIADGVGPIVADRISADDDRFPHDALDRNGDAVDDGDNHRTIPIVVSRRFGRRTEHTHHGCGSNQQDQLTQHLGYSPCRRLPLSDV
jgi:hypothetical protein